MATECPMCGQMEDGYASIDVAARLFDVHPDVVRRWCREERFQGANQAPGPSGRKKIWRIPVSSLLPALSDWQANGGAFPRKEGPLVPERAKFDPSESLSEWTP